MAETATDRQDRVPDEQRHLWAYPRPGRHGARRWLPSWRLATVASLAVVALVIGAGVALYASVEIPEVDAQVSYQTTSVYFADPQDSTGAGAKIGDLPGINRTVIACDDIPQHVKDAVVASEDRTFYTNSGVDARGIARSVRSGQQGSWTLTQQYVENYYGSAGSGFKGRLDDAILAVKIDRQQSKDQILCNYLNVVYWGRGQTHGIQAAAQAYFAKDAKDLTVSQAALLAGIIPSPNKWDPAKNPDTAQVRWTRTLDYLAADTSLKSHLTPSQKDDLVFPQMCTDPTATTGDCVVTYEPERAYTGPTADLMVSAAEEAAALVGVSADDLAHGGYTIVTTVDEQTQAKAGPYVVSRVIGPEGKVWTR
ncbi:MAG: transglycosylase domain-containing protein [Micrococcales bacterium]|nr:transglycosylase domain-containing protein [Micrococcales bacterium]